jgi:hypothetical protein
MTDQPISFGDTVRVRHTEATRAAGVAGLTGPVYGETTPSVTGVDVIGEVTGDYAINVYFKDREESLWFAPDLLEFVDHGVGAEITINGVNKKWTRTESGEWEESPGAERHRSFWQRITGRVFKRKE